MPTSPAASASARGVISKASPYSVSDTVARLETVIRDKGLMLFAIIDHDGEAAKVGLSMQETKLLIFGSPRAGTPLMVASPLIALDLPLKALVWRDRDHTVFVSYNATAYLAERYGIPLALVKNIAGIDAVVAAALAASPAAPGS